MVTQALNAFGAASSTGLNPETQALIEWLAQQDAERRENYDRAREYYHGEQEVQLTDRVKRYLDTSGLPFRANFCSLVVDTLAERLKVIGFSGPNEQANAMAWDFWRRNRMDNTQAIIHAETVLLGDNYVMVDWDEERGQPRFTPQRPEMIIPHYNETTQQIDVLSKKWIETKIGADPRTRLNLYYPDRIEKYVARGGTWQPFRDEDATWPLSWRMKTGEPIGVSTIHFRNKPLSNIFGESEISDVIPLQDLLNKTVVDLAMLLDNMAFPQRWTLNISHNNSRVDIVPGSISEYHSDPDVPSQVGQYDAASPEGLLKAIEAQIQDIAGISRTPQYLFQIMGDAPSGEALKTAESGLVQKANRRQVNFGNSWEDVMLMAFRVQAAFGPAAPQLDALELQTEWEDPESRNEESHLKSLALKAELGVPKRQIWREMGYDEEQIAQMEQDLQDERVADTNLGAAILDSFSRGEV